MKSQKNILKHRSSGILLPISSLPSKYGIGDIGPSAYEWVDHLHDSGQSYWQILPVSIFDKYGSPYASYSAFGAHPLYISLELLKDEGLLEQKELDYCLITESSEIDLNLVSLKKMEVLKKASQRFYEEGNQVPDDFHLKYKYWLPNLIKYMTTFFASEKDHLFWQYVFYKQWNKLKSYANKKSIRLFGDLPIFVGLQSMDVKYFKEYFKLDSKGLPSVITGAPPDDFSIEGQLWGTPNYNWENLQKSEFEWWVQRIQYHSELYDLLRLDHFIGYYNVWETPYGEKTAKKGQWVVSHGEQLLSTLHEKVPQLPYIAEDLGEVSEGVHELRKQFQIPAMRVLQFAYGSDEKNMHLPHQIDEQTVYYTGTHDNKTLKQWIDEISPNEKRNIQKYNLDLNPSSFIQEVYQSKAKLAITPYQDFLRKGKEARINIPGTTLNNWKWRLRSEDMDDRFWKEIKSVTKESNREKE